MARRLSLVLAQLFCAHLTLVVSGQPAFAAPGNSAAAAVPRRHLASRAVSATSTRFAATAVTYFASLEPPLPPVCAVSIIWNCAHPYFSDDSASVAFTEKEVTSAPLPDAPPSTAGNVTADTGLTLLTRIVVKSRNTELTAIPVSTTEFTGIQVRESAGTFGDLPRFLQTLPGLVSGSDVQNASFVRGGNSFENLYVIDRIEVPNINHLALANSTGGLNSMLDTESIASASFSSGDLGSSFSSHISSITDIRTLELPARSATSFDFGYSGAGFRMSRPIGLNKTLLLSARESVTNLFIKDVGLNGSPEFTNSFVKFTIDPSAQDHIYIDSLSGRDGLNVRPDGLDAFETNAYDTSYSGWRNTTGLVWQHTFQTNAMGTMIVSNSQNTQKLTQRDQVHSDALLFQQNANDGQTQLKYEYMAANENGSALAMGVDMRLNRLNDDTVQTADMFTPYSTSTTPVAAYDSNARLSPVDKAAYLDMTENLAKRLVLKAGFRFEDWGFTEASLTGCSLSSAACSKRDFSNSRALLPHASLSFLPAKRLNLRASWSRTAQLPPYAVMLSAPSNGYLTPIHLQQAIAGMTAQFNNRLSVSIEGYRKVYTDYPVSTAYQQVSLATLMPTITQPFNLLSMTSQGKGLAQGVELAVKHSPWHHIFAEANLTLARARFSGTDGIYRSGLSDLPVVANVTGGFNLRRFLITVRNTTTSGRPYTPLLDAASEQQNRPIYDLTQLNVPRGSLYNRLDLAVNRELLLHGKVLRLHGGFINLLNRQNFFENDWRPRCPQCGAETQPSMGLQPDFSMSYTF